MFWEMLWKVKFIRNLFNLFWGIDKHPMGVHFVKVIPPEDRARCIAGIEKWYDQQDKKDMRRLIVTFPLYTKSKGFIGYGLQLFSDKSNSDISDFWAIYDSIEKECNI